MAMETVCRIKWRINRAVWWWIYIGACVVCKIYKKSIIIYLTTLIISLNTQSIKFLYLYLLHRQIWSIIWIFTPPKTDNSVICVNFLPRRANLSDPGHEHPFMRIISFGRLLFSLISSVNIIKFTRSRLMSCSHTSLSYNIIRDYNYIIRILYCNKFTTID